MKEGQSGQLMIIVALGMTAFLGFAALTVDLGYAYSQKRSAQNGADSAALAGIRMVRMATGSTTATDIYNEIVRTANLNGSSQVASAEFLDENKSSLGPVQSFGGAWSNVAGVGVNTQITFNTFFARVVGKPTLIAGGRAGAMSFKVTDLSGNALLPIGLKKRYEDLVDETVYTIWDSDMEASGNAGWLDFNGGANSVAELADWIENGFHPTPSDPFMFYENEPNREDWDGDPADDEDTSVRLPLISWLEGATGVVSSLQDEMEEWMTPGKIAWVLLFNKLDGPGANAKYQIVGIAPFYITNVDLSGSDKKIKGRFDADIEVVSGDDLGEVETEGVTTIRLVSY